MNLHSCTIAVHGTSQLDDGFWPAVGSEPTGYTDSASPRRVSIGFRQPVKARRLTNTKNTYTNESRSVKSILESGDLLLILITVTLGAFETSSKETDLALVLGQLLVLAVNTLAALHDHTVCFVQSLEHRERWRVKNKRVYNSKVKSTMFCLYQWLYLPDGIDRWCSNMAVSNKRKISL